MSKEHLIWLRDHIQEAYQSSILENFLNFEIVEMSEGKVIYKTKIIDKHCNMYGYVHGGTLASIADAVMGVSCVTLEKRIVTIDMSISYIKNVQEGSTITAVGEVINNGNRVMHAVVEIVDEDNNLLVRAQGSFFVMGDFQNYN
jgi:uncharacterized domain 1